MRAVGHGSARGRPRLTAPPSRARDGDMTRPIFLVLAVLSCGLVYAAESRTAPAPPQLPVPQKPIGVQPSVAPDCARNPDADHDGVKAIGCGGTDCDDNDPNRKPTNPEVCDWAGHDEDCDLTTYGKRDVDGDGFPDGLCRNIDPVTHAVVSQGTDCDDTKRYVHPGTQICASDSTVSVCQGPNALTIKCPPATPYCARQPNDLGVCVPAPR